jgi:hypothetical protein
MEQATRLGVYKAAIRKGMTPVEAAYQSRESTTDFARVGSKMKEISPVIAFFNAGLQGADKSFRNFSENKVGTTLKGLAAVTIPSVLLWLMNKDDDEYKEIPQWQKDLFWIIKVNGTFYRIPKPFLYGQIFGTLPEKFLDYANSKDKKLGDTLAESMSSIYGAVSPISGDPASGLLPTAIKPIIEVLTNWNFFTQRNIVSDSQQNKLPSEQYGKYTSETAKTAGKVLNVSPAKLEHLIRGYTGGSGQYLLDASDKLLNAIRKAGGKEVKPKRPIEAADIPLVRGFVVRDPKSGQAESIQKFYDNVDNIDTLYSTYRGYIKSGRKLDAESLYKKNPELALGKNSANIREQMSLYSKKVDSIIADKNMSNEEKRKKIDEIETERLEFAKKMNSYFDGKKRK